MKLNTAVNEFLSAIEGRSKHTRANYAQALRRFQGVIGNRNVSTLTGADAARFMDALAADDLAPGSRAAYTSAVRSFLSYCQDAGYVARSPLHVLKRPRVEVTSMNRYLDANDARALLEAARTTGERLATALLLTTGLRVSEATSAQWRHLFLDPDGRLGLTVLGKGGKTRVVAIPEALWVRVADDRQAQGASTELDERDATPLLADRRGTPYTRQGLLQLVRRVTERAGLRKRVSPHWLRHSYGTLAAQAGVPVFQIQADMGHSRLETSQRYVHWARGLKDAGAAVVAQTLFSMDVGRERE